MIKKAFSLFSNDMDECFSVPLAGRPIERPFLKNGNCGPATGESKNRDQEDTMEKKLQAAPAWPQPPAHFRETAEIDAK